MADKAVQKNKATAEMPAGKKPVLAPTKQLVKAHARNLRLSPRKMRLVTNLVRNMRVADALTQLQFTNKKGAKMLTKLLMSAVANAEHNFSMNRDGLFIKTITCDMGTVLKRSFPRARGSASIIRRKMSHINVELEERSYKAKKIRSVVPKPAKKDPTIRKSAPAAIASEFPTDEKVKESHPENDRTLVEEKTSPENQG